MYNNKLQSPLSVAVILILLSAILFLEQNLYLIPLFIGCAFTSSFIAVIELSQKKVLFKKPPILSTLKALCIALSSLPFFLLIRNLPNGLWLILFCCTTLWVCDSAALFIGRAIGKNKLTSISPNKTIEGSIGGSIAGSIGGIIIATLGGLPIITFGLIALGLSVIGQIGDIHESLAKRHFNLKDSSQLLPGHGGIYDRCDSFIFVLPLFYVTLIAL